MRTQPSLHGAGLGALSLWLLFLLLAAVGCGAQPDPDATRASGTISLALSATAHGHNYQLRHATFVITGPTPKTLSSDDQPDVATLSAVLAIGSYSATLAATPAWQLWRLDPSGAVQVTASLVSPASGTAPFTITADAITPVVFRFMTDGTPVTFGDTGSVVISTEVDESAAGASGGDGGPPPPPATCSDGLKNGTEGDIDCGGTCALCANYRSCNVAADCQSGACDVGACLPLAHLMPGNLPLPFAESDNPTPTSGSNIIAVASPLDACGPIAPMAGTIALIQRGTCTFEEKAINAQNAGAVGSIVFDNLPDDIVEANLPNSPLPTGPVIVITQHAGAQIQTLLAQGVTSVVWGPSPASP